MPKKKGQNSRKSSPEKSAHFVQHASKTGSGTGCSGTLNEPPNVSRGRGGGNQSHEAIFQQMQEMFGGKVEAEVIHMVLSEAGWIVEDAVDTLFTLAGHSGADDTGDMQLQHSTQLNLQTVALSLSSTQSPGYVTSSTSQVSQLDSFNSLEMIKDSYSPSSPEPDNSPVSTGMTLSGDNPNLGDLGAINNLNKCDHIKPNEEYNLSFTDMYNLSKHELELECNMLPNTNHPTSTVDKVCGKNDPDANFSLVDMYNLVKIEVDGEDCGAMMNDPRNDSTKEKEAINLNQLNNRPVSAVVTLEPNSEASGIIEANKKACMEVTPHIETGYFVETAGTGFHEPPLVQRVTKVTNCVEDQNSNETLKDVCRGHDNMKKTLHDNSDNSKQNVKETLYHGAPSSKIEMSKTQDEPENEKSGNNPRSLLSADASVFKPITPIENSVVSTEQMHRNLQSWHHQHEQEFVVPNIPLPQRHNPMSSWNSFFNSITTPRGPYPHYYQGTHGPPMGDMLGNHPQKTLESLHATDPATAGAEAWQKKPAAVFQPGHFKPTNTGHKNKQEHSQIAVIKEEINQQLLAGVKLLIIMRGCPGSGKTSLARSLKHKRGVILSTDDFFMVKDVYKFDVSKLGYAHEWNQKRAKKAFDEGRSPVIIDNTNTQAWEMKPYIVWGMKQDYECILLEPPTPWKFKVRGLFSHNTHGVSFDAIKNMLDRYEHNLTVEKILGKKDTVRNSSSVPSDKSKTKSDGGIIEKSNENPKNKPTVAANKGDAGRNDTSVMQSHGIKTKSNGGKVEKINEKTKNTPTKLPNKGVAERNNTTMQLPKKTKSESGKVEKSSEKIKPTKAADKKDALRNTAGVCLDKNKAKSESFKLKKNSENPKRMPIQTACKEEGILSAEGHSRVKEDVKKTNDHSANQRLTSNVASKWMNKTAEKHDALDQRNGDFKPKRHFEKDIHGPASAAEFSEMVVQADQQAQSDEISIKDEPIINSHVMEDDSIISYMISPEVHDYANESLANQHFYSAPISETEPVDLDAEFDAFLSAENKMETSYWTQEDSVPSSYDIAPHLEVTESEPQEDIDWIDPKPQRNRKKRQKNSFTSDHSNEFPAADPMNEVTMDDETGLSVDCVPSLHVFKVASLKDIIKSQACSNSGYTWKSEESNSCAGIGDGNHFTIGVQSVDESLSERGLTTSTCFEIECQKQDDLAISKETNWCNSGKEELSTVSFPSTNGDSMSSLNEVLLKKISKMKRSSRKMAARLDRPKLDPLVKETLISQNWSLPDFESSSDSQHSSSVEGSPTKTLKYKLNVFRDNTAQTLPQDFSMSHKISEGLLVHLNDALVRTCRPRFINTPLTPFSTSSNEENPTSPLSSISSKEGSPTIQYKLKLDKSSSTNDLEEQNQQDDIDFLHSCFPEVSNEDLTHVLKICQGDTQLAINNLLDSGTEYNETGSMDAVLDEDSDSDGLFSGSESCIDLPSRLSHLCIDNMVSLPVESGSRGAIYQEADSSNSSRMTSRICPNTSSESMLPNCVKNEPILPNEDVTTYGQRGAVDMDSVSAESSPNRGSLELKLDREFAQHLQSIFGTVDESGDEVSIPLSISLAYAIHQAWKHSLQQPCQPNVEQLEQDEKLARILQAQENEQRIIQQGVHLTRNRGNAPPVNNLRQIMEEEKVFEVLKQSEMSSPDSLAIRLKRQKLYEAFPGIDQAAIEAIFQVNGCDIGKTMLAIRDTCDVDAKAQVVMTPEAALEYQQQLDDQENEDNLKEEHHRTYYQSYEEPDYEDYRGEASTHVRQRQECFQKAQDAHRRGMKEVAVFYANQGHLHTQKIREANLRASHKILESKNAVISKTNTIDLHGLHVVESLEILRQVLEGRQEELSFRPDKRKMFLDVITGRGNRSRGGVAKIRPAVIDFLKRNNYRYTDAHPGMVKVYF